MNISAEREAIDNLLDEMSRLHQHREDLHLALERLEQQTADVIAELTEARLRAVEARLI